MKKIRSVSQVALKDIAKYLDVVYCDRHKKDSCIVSPESMNTKEVRLLNKELGIHKINKQDNFKNLTNGQQ